MPDPTAADPTGTGSGQAATISIPLTIPDDVRQKFPDVIELITGSESMNDEERQYWINILPIMTPEQLQNLRDILTTERQQLASIDAQYSKAIDALGQEEFNKKVGEERQRRAEERTQAESSTKTAEEEAAAKLLENMEGV